MTGIDIPAFVQAFTQDRLRARSAALEALCREAWEGTPPTSRWRLHVVEPPVSFELPRYRTESNELIFPDLPAPGVACWLGDFPPGRYR